MKRTNLFAILAISFSLSGMITSCTNDTNVGTDASVSATATDASQAATVSDAVIAEADQYITTATFTTSGIAAVKASETSIAGPIITVSLKDSVSFPKTITIDYGTTGITGKRGNVLKGKIMIVVSDKLWKVNSSKTITFLNFYLIDNKITGSKVITYKGLIALNPVHNIVVKDTITRTDGTTVIWNSDRNRERTDNNGTVDPSDDKYSITGSSNGVNAKGVAYTMVITANDPLIIYNDYPHFVQGSVTLATEKRTALIDYGDGTKDDKATITINGVTKDITLKK